MNTRLSEISERLKAATAYDDWVLGGCSGRMIQYKGGGDVADVDVKSNAVFLINAPADISFLLDALREAEERCTKHEGHEHCVTPCDSMRIQDSNHSAWLLEKERAEKAESALHDATERLGRAEKVIEKMDCDCAAEWDREGAEPGPCPRCSALAIVSPAPTGERI